MGGLPRRATFISREKSKEAGILILDTGNFVAARPLGEAAIEPSTVKTELILKIMDRMGYAAAAVGEKDIYLGLERLRSLIEESRVKFLSANLMDGKDRNIFEPYHLFKVGTITVGVVGLTSPPGDRRLFDRRAAGVTVKDPVLALKETVKKIRDRCHLVVVLSNIGYAKDLELAEAVPGIDVIISGGTKRFMTRPVITDRTLITSGYYEGRAIGRLITHMEGEITGWISREELQFMDRQISAAEAGAGTPEEMAKLDALVKEREAAGKRTLYEPDMVHLDPSIPDDPLVAGMITDYRKELKKKTPGTGVQAAGRREKVRYTGTAACSGCHESRHRFWLTTDHSRAFSSLAPKDAEADPDCIGCHVTGYMRRTGYWPKAPRQDLRGVQCEACHGVGSLHTDNPELYSLLHLPAAPQCMDCHTESQDDDFDYFRDRKLICAEAE